MVHVCHTRGVKHTRMDFLDSTHVYMHTQYVHTQYVHTHVHALAVFTLTFVFTHA